MTWVLLMIGFAIPVAIAAYFFVPTLKTIFGPDFEPTPKDDASVENAVQTRMVDGGGGL
jgi:hypothetical protein